MTDLRGSNFSLYVTSMAVATNGNVFVAGHFPDADAHRHRHQCRDVERHTMETAGHGRSRTVAIRRRPAHGAGRSAKTAISTSAASFTSAGGVTAHSIARWDGVRWWPLDLRNK